MACYRPWKATQLTDGRIVSFARKGMDTRRELELPCGKCLGCRLTRQRQWAIRCLHEAQETRDKDGNKRQSIFATLTEDEEHYEPSLNHRNYQLFMKRLRKNTGEPLKYFMCGEYGTQYGRPHYHAIIFGAEFKDQQRYDSKQWESPELTKTWGRGQVTYGTVTYKSAAYVAGYCVKSGLAANTKTTVVDERTGEMTDRTPEYGRMSQGIGQKWIKKYWKEVYETRDGIVQAGGKIIPAPKYYDRELIKINGILLDEKEYDRYKKGVELQKDNTPERLKVRETVAKAQFNQRTKKL